MAADQRGRMLAGLAEVMWEKGYAATSVADVIARAGVSRETFYQQFESKQACFLAAFEQLRAQVVRALLPLPDSGSPLARFTETLRRYLDALADDPRTARLFLVEVYAVGPNAVHRRLELQQDFVAGLSDVFGARNRGDRFACELLVAAIATLTTNALIEGDGEGSAAVRALHGPLVELAGRLFA